MHDESRVRSLLWLRVLFIGRVLFCWGLRTVPEPVIAVVGIRCPSVVEKVLQWPSPLPYTSSLGGKKFVEFKPIILRQISNQKNVFDMKKNI